MASVSRGDYGGSSVSRGDSYGSYGDSGGYASYVCPAPAADVGAGDFLNPNLLLILAVGAGALGGMTIINLKHIDPDCYGKLRQFKTLL